MAEVFSAKVAVDNTAYSFDKEFDYLVPQQLLSKAVPGCRVLIPFGNGNRKRQGMILAVSPCQNQECLKPLLAVLDGAPLLNQEMLLLVPWIKERYFCTLFEAAKLLIPTGIGIKLRIEYELSSDFTGIPENLSPEEQRILQVLLSKRAPIAREKLLVSAMLPLESDLPDQLCEKGFLKKNSGAVRQVGDATRKMVRLQEGFSESQKLTPKQKETLRIVQEADGISLKELCYYAGVTPAVPNALAAKGAIYYEDCEIYRNPYENIKDPETREQIILTEEQNRAYENLLDQYHHNTGAISLLYGVTGSGKTLVFMKLIDAVCAEGKGVIVMVPEISLTPQTVSLFHARYGKKVAVFHSALSLAERLDEWKRVKNGEAIIAIGTRSAVFAPFSEIGLIIMDEEQEYTYKSESSPRYHARDVAKFRSAYHKALLLLCSATPSMESFYFAKHGRYSLNRLSGRYGEATLPEVTVVDMNEELENGNTSLISETLLDALNENLDHHQQSIILLNRRGYHTFSACRSCGHVITCPHCSISMTYHAANHRLMCHYCGFSIPFTDQCPKCGDHTVRCSGFGTQRAEEQIQEQFPEARILRLDADTTMTRFSYERQLNDFSQGKYDMIVGTQMVAKGLDFENVTLAGVLSADQSLYNDDFRSFERAFDLFTQVVGRSGRGKYPGRAIIHTYPPESSVIRLEARQDYDAFYEEEIAFRKAMLYPPFADITVVGFVGTKEVQVKNASVRFLSMLSDLAGKDYSGLPLRVLNPSPAAVAKVSNKYRYKLIVKCRNDKKFREMISRLLKSFAAIREFSQVTAYVDCNPDIIL